MKLRSIPEPVLSPFPRKKKPDLKPLVQVAAPSPAQAASPKAENKSAGNQPETKTEKSADTPKKDQENRVKPGNNQEINADRPPETPKGKKQDEQPPVEPVEQATLGTLPDGTVVPTPFQPVDPITALASPNPTVAFVMLRQLKDMRGPMPDTSNGALEVLDRLEMGLKTGQDISSLHESISTHIMGEEEHNELFSRLHNSIDRERAMEIFKSRSKWEDFCHACMRRGDLSIIEGMALMSYFNAQLATIFSRLDKKQSKGEVAVSREAADLVSKVNRPTLEQNKQLQRKFDAAQPQEREILRKLGFKLESALAARITKTTTETVEIVQDGPHPAV